ncbi:colicin V production protein [Candidatus Photodesmus katoptron]|uniref:Colicin V production protein n=1 Tax=Candidatus Photodesmus katoptron Akat1 TaxID=1236703 RepID=S3DG86_9GAMM|nr:CvpA family protein [Candidatus Photodesmus katoptron]EPE37437.1 colicin V production protein [Candidatus Photodesmus katoptron Akat1]KEY90164.1 colicin V production protein [Candidatus Photodesmus katoptron]
MNGLDIIILSIVSLSSLISLFRGFLKEALSLIVWLGSFFVAVRYYIEFSVYFANIEVNLLRSGVAAVVLFITTLFVGAIFSRLVCHLIQKTSLSGTDRVFGMIFGTFRGVLIISAGLFFIGTFTSASTTTWWKTSKLIPKFNLINESLSEYLEEI